MGLFVVRGSSKPKDRDEPVGQPFYSLRENYWDPEVKAQRQRHIAYLGQDATITLEKARQVCDEKEIDPAELQELASKGKIKIVEDEETEAAAGNGNGRSG